MQLETITFNFAGKVRRAVLNGKQYLVAPMTLIVPGVLNGSKGRLFYPPEEVSKDPTIWNNVDLTLGHPTHPVTNEHQSAKDEGVLERVGLGFTKNGRWDGKALRADGWFDEERTQKLAPDVYNKLSKSEPFELSTGLYTDNEEKAGNHVGKAYDYIARNYRADHVAVLVNEVGACSVRDGCGVVVNADGSFEIEDLADNTDNEEIVMDDQDIDLTENAFSPQARAAAAAARRASKHANAKSSVQSKLTGSNDHVHSAILHGNAAEHHRIVEQDRKKRGDHSGALESGQAAAAHEAAKTAHEHAHKLKQAESTRNTMEIAVNERDKMLAKLTANCSCDKDKAALNGLSDDTLEVLYNSQPPVEKKETPVVNAAVVVPVPVPDKPMSERMTPQELAIWNYGRQTMENHKHQLVGRLVANVADPERKKAMTANLLTKEIPELNDLLSLMPAAVVQNTTHNPGGTDLPPIYLGAAGGDYSTPTVNRGSEMVEVTDQWPPTLNYEEHSGIKDGKLTRVG